MKARQNIGFHNFFGETNMRLSINIGQRGCNIKFIHKYNSLISCIFVNLVYYYYKFPFYFPWIFNKITQNFFYRSTHNFFKHFC